MTWPDLVIGGIAVLFAVKGYRRGFVSELVGAVALFVAIVAAFFWYPWWLDGSVVGFTHLGPGSAHIVGMVLFAVAVYAIVMLIGWLLGRIAKMPVLGIGNAIAGALVGVGKTLVGAWAILYVLLFFPLTPDLRADLHRSALVALVTQPNPEIDHAFRELLPWFVRPFVGPIFHNHHAWRIRRQDELAAEFIAFAAPDCAGAQAAH